jgi:N-acetylgalactosamine-N,N'-diacetylbacillosaminyl-diphospho-undecaprenol 4-alpha-N-acetylgalactosaminyltransferase
MGAKKKLVIFIYSLGKGGAERIVSTLLFCLQDRFDISLVLLKNDIAYAIPDNVKVDVLSLNPFLFKKYCEENKIDVSLSLLTKPNFISIISKFLGNKTRIVVSEHTNTILWYSKFMQKLISLFYKKADRVIAVSKKIEYNLNNLLGVKNTTVIYNPYNVSSIIEQQDISDDVDFISIGTLYEVKNHKLLIEAFSLVENTKSNLYILGDGPLKKELEDFVKSLSLENRVKFLGFQPNPYKYLKKAKVFVLTSNNEGLPNVLIEALALKCAIISTDCISGPREILAPNTDFNFQLVDEIEYAKYGVLVPIKNKNLLSKAMNDIDIDSYKNQSTKRAYDFDIYGRCEEYSEVLSSI